MLDSSGYSVLAVVRAYRGDGTEGVVVSTRYNARVSTSSADTNAVGLLTSLAAHMKSTLPLP